MRKKLEGERGYLALEDLWIKSKFARSNMPIHEVGRGGERKNPRGRRKKRKKARAGRLGPRLKHKLGAKIYGAELPVVSPPRGSRAKELGVRDAGAETC